MVLSDLLLNKISAPGLWLIKSRNSSMDISQLVFDLAVMGSMFLKIYSSCKERINSTVMSMIINDRMDSTIDAEDRLYVENDVSDFYEHGSFGMMTELNDYLPNGCFWEDQVWICDYDPLFIENSICKTIIVDEVKTFNNDASSANFLRQTNRLAIQEEKSVFLFINEHTINLNDHFIDKRLINKQLIY